MSAQANKGLHQTPIAIIGMGSIFPNARNLREFWDNIMNKADCIIDVPATHWLIDDYYDPDPTAPDKTYCKRGGFLPFVDFDPMEFGLPPNILEVTDVSQMLGLLVAKEALADAGYLNTTAEIRDHMGIVLGVGGGQKQIVPLSSRLQYPVWRDVLRASGVAENDIDTVIEKIKLAYIRWEENSFPGMLGNVIAGRIANRFDLGGINCVTDAACASSMSALKLAISELVEHRADMMITGGVDTDNSIVMYMNFSKTPAFTKSDQPRPFDAQSDGMMIGEGVAMMILKRLDDAERDGDKIYAVIKGIGSSSDGRFKSIYAPRGEGQEKALKRAYEDAGFSAATVSLFEAHGTGTVAGDTTEVTTAIRYLNSVDTRKQHIALGSVKSQIGHAKAAAGIAGLVKVALALHHKVIPPTINVETPNPKFDLENSAFYISGETRPWIQEGDTPRRAGVSSFGFGGTNFHVVMEEYTPDHKKAYRLQQTAQAIILTAPTPADLTTRIQDTLKGLQGEDAEAYFLNLTGLTRKGQIAPDHARVGFVAATAAEAIPLLQAAAELIVSKANLDEWQHPKGVYYRRNSLNFTGRVVALFAGQGSQYLHMGRELAFNFPEMRDTYHQIDMLLANDGKETLSNVVFPRPAFSTAEKDAQEAKLQDTHYAQPAIGAMSAGMYRLLQNAGFRADFTAGHSFGEVTALWAAGAISTPDYYLLIKARGAAMARPNDPNFDAGTMLAVTGDAAMLEHELAGLPGVQVANRNSRTQVVLAGATSAIRKAETVLKAKGYRVVALSVSAAFHTPFVKHAQQPFAQVIHTITFRPAQASVYSNATAQPYPADPASMQQMLAEHILQPVQFRDEIEHIYAAGGYLFVEFGPRNVLTNLVKDILGDRPHVALALNASRQKDSDRQLREGVVQLMVLGLPLTTLDPYYAEPDMTPKKKGMTVKLNGAAYLSSKTREAYQTALTDGFKLSSANGHHPVEPQIVTQVVYVPQPVDTLTASTPTPVHEAETMPLTPFTSSNDLLNSLDKVLTQLREHQRETLRMQEQFQQNQAEYFRIFFELTQQQAALNLSPHMMESISQSMMRFHDHQAETLKLHERFMSGQSAATQGLLDVLRQQYAVLANVPPAPTNGSAAPTYTPPPTPVKAPAPIAPAALPAAPVPVSAVVAPVPPAPAAPAAPPPPAVVHVPVPVPSPTPAPSALSGVEVTALSNAMLRIVADKTGYPSDMLELSMDMEADLGIDSIKRVEILGAMRDEFPNLPQFSPEELGELRTLAQIVDYMQMSVRKHGGEAAMLTPSMATPTPISTPTPAPVMAAAPAPVGPAVITPVTPAPASAAVDVTALSNAMLRIVADKTGYPSDMLELSMDMEADLGIDSIKRVEILGAMRDEFPALPQFSPEELGELRTLGQIVDYMRASVNGSNGHQPTPTSPSPTSTPSSFAPSAPTLAVASAAVTAAPVTNGSSNGYGLDLVALSNAMLRIVGDKTGYPVDMLELSMDMEADLGIDSIKRVEILGAMRDEFPALPQFSPEELGELRTLGQIVDYMQASVNGAASAAAASEGSNGVGTQTHASLHRETLTTTPTSITPVPGSHIPRLNPLDFGIERSIVELRRLPAADWVEYRVAAGSVCLITDDGTPATGELAAQTAAQGWQAVVLSFPTTIIPTHSQLPAGTQRVTLPDMSESVLQATLKPIPNIGAFIHLNPNANLHNGALFMDSEKAIVKHVFLMAKHLKAALHHNTSGRKAFITVTRLDGTFGTATQSAFGTIAGGLFGLVKTLSLEWDGVFCRALDLAPTMTAAQTASAIIAELHDPNCLITEVAYGAQGRVTLTARQAATHHITYGAN